MTPLGSDQSVRTIGIHLCPRCRTRIVDWKGEEPPACGMHFPERVEGEYVEVVPIADVLQWLRDDRYTPNSAAELFAEAAALGKSERCEEAS